MSAKKEFYSQNMMIYEMQAELCGALASPLRLHILDLLSEGDMTATDLLEYIQIPKANMSQHLSVLRDAGIIQSRKEGQFQVFSLAIPRIREACSLVRSLLSEKIANQEKRNSDLIKTLKKQR